MTSRKRRQFKAHSSALVVSVFVCAAMGACGGGTSSEAPAAAALAGTGALKYLAAGQLHAAWNGSLNADVVKPGVKISFYGSASGCAGAVDGPVGSPDAGVFAEAAAQTGIAPDGAYLWTPTGSAALCDAANRSRSGSSYVVLDTAARSGGVGMYTVAGPGSDGQLPFFEPFGPEGQGGTGGANAHIEGNFVGFRSDWASLAATKPFVARSGEVGAASIQSAQRVASLQVPGVVQGGEIVQVQQTLGLALINTGCIDARIDADHQCQLQYQFLIAVARAGVSDWSKEDWLKPTLLLDPGQGNIPVLSSALPAAGTEAAEPETGLPLFTSTGAPTMHSAGSMLGFGASINMTQLANLLRIVASRGLHKPVSAVSEVDLSRSWGSRWDDPSAWTLLETRVGQEIYDPQAKYRAVIGGSFTDITVSTAPVP